MASIPTRRDDGLYSKNLSPPFERFYVQRIRIALTEAGVGRIDSTNAGHLMHAIGQETQLMRSFAIQWPESLSSRSACDAYVEKRPDSVKQLAAVHEMGAYAWFCEEAVALTLLDYLFPRPNSLEDFVIPAASNGPPERGRTSAKLFAPRNLDRNHLPFLVKSADSLCHMMKTHLKELLLSEEFEKITRGPVSSIVAGNYYLLVRHQWKGGHLITTEADVRHFGQTLFRVTETVYNALTGFYPRTRSAHRETMIDGSVLPDRIFSGISQDPIILWRNERPELGDHHISAIWDRLTERNNPFIYDKSETDPYFVTAWEEEEAIIGSLAWHAYVTEQPNPTQRPRWAILFSGTQFMIFLMVYVLDSKNEKSRVAFFASPPMPATDPELSICTAALYMALTSEDRIDQATLLDKLGIRQPASPDALPPPRQLRPTSTVDDHQTLDEADGVNVQAPGTCAVPMTRIKSIPSSTQSPNQMLHAEARDDWPLLEPSWPLAPIDGGFGSVHRTRSGEIIKYAHREGDAWEAIFREAKVYLQLQSHGVRSVPKFRGLFASRADFALILSDEGERVEYFSDLTDEQRAAIFCTLKAIHEAGVEHGDLEPRNVVIGSDGPVIIDFSHSSTGHVCPGTEACRELQEVSRELSEDDRYKYTGQQKLI